MEFRKLFSRTNCFFYDSFLCFLKNYDILTRKKWRIKCEQKKSFSVNRNNDQETPFFLGKKQNRKCEWKLLCTVGEMEKLLSILFALRDPSRTISSLEFYLSIVLFNLTFILTVIVVFLLCLFACFKLNYFLKKILKFYITRGLKLVSNIIIFYNLMMCTVSIRFPHNRHE